MTLSKPIKIAVGVATVIVMLLPMGLFLIWISFAFPFFMGNPDSDFPFQYFDMMMAVVFPMICLINILIYGLIAFYIIHAVKNQAANDVIRIIALLAIFFIPYLGMPIYYVIYILMSTPPSWALKEASPSTEHYSGSPIS